MDLPRNPITTPVDENPLVERILGTTVEWPRPFRLLLTIPLLASTIGVALLIWPGGAFVLAMGYFGALHRWVIEDGERPRISDAWICALITLPAVLVLTRISWTEPDGGGILTPADRLWWPLAIVTVALALDRVRRRPTPTEALGSSLSEAGRRRQSARRKLE